MEHRHPPLLHVLSYLSSDPSVIIDSSTLLSQINPESGKTPLSTHALFLSAFDVGQDKVHTQVCTAPPSEGVRLCLHSGEIPAR